MIPDDVLHRAGTLLRKYKVCDHCLGRAFMEVEGADNEERGRKIREVLEGGQTPPEECYFCEGIFSRIDCYAGTAIRELQGYVFRTFRVGSHVPEKIIHREEVLWEVIGAKSSETIKKHINREVGKKIKGATGKRYDAENPDIDVIVDVEAEDVRVQSNPLYIYGRYRKYADMPQSKWPCRYCRGRGCERCGYSGRQWREAVEYYIADVLLGVTGGKDTKFHAAGREDIDARMLGTGRPFVMEIVKPRIRFEEWEWLRGEINAHGEGKMEVLCLMPSNRKEVQDMKASEFNKTYRAFVECEGTVNEDDLKGLKELEGETVCQRTPERIKHRRPDIIRRKKVLQISWESAGNTEFVLYITAESGLYIKEFVSGDGGRTTPSVSEILGKPCRVTRLDVMEVHGGRRCSK